MPDSPLEVRGDELELVVRGRAFTGWERMTLARALDALSAQFELVVSDRDPLPVRAGDECQVRLAGELLVTGHVDAMALEGGSERTQMTVSGRDKTADLVDCSAGLDAGPPLVEASEWSGLSLLELVDELARPLGVQVRLLPSAFREGLGEVFDLFRRQPGETAWSAIERACRRRGVLAFSSGSGELLLDRPASAAAQVALLEGERGNVKRWRVTVDHRQRFSLYEVRAQTSSTDDYSGVPALEVAGSASDQGIARFRPLLVLGEGSMTFDDAQDRAGWEANVRASRSERLEVEVQGWRQVPGGRVWTLNETVQVRIPSAGMDSTLLVDEVVFARGRDGTTTTLGLTRPDAYRPEPVVEDLDDFLGEEE